MKGADKGNRNRKEKGRMQTTHRERVKKKKREDGKKAQK